MKKLFLPFALALSIVVAACGSSDDPALEGAAEGGSTTTEAEDHNDEDVAFAQGMIAHHRQAIEMADLVIANGESPEVEALAEKIKADQTPEIQTLSGWLADWDEPETAEGGDHAGTDVDGEGEDMAMMSDEEMSKLEKAKGAEADKMFIEMMIRHHRSAIDMAQTEVDEGQFPDATAMAEDIIKKQEAEITEMTELLEKLGA